ncbi:MAG: hypothetical protein R2789_12750 [Microthrixaceae bacterium]
MTPEVAGPRLVIRTVWPPLVAVAGFLPVLVAANVGRGDPAPAVAVTALPVLMLVAAVFGWVRFRDNIHASHGRSDAGLDSDAPTGDLMAKRRKSKSAKPTVGGGEHPRPGEDLR